MDHAHWGMHEWAWSLHLGSVKSLSPGQRRIFRRLALAGALIVVVGLTRGLDAAMVVAFSLAVMEIDAHSS